MRRRDLEHVIRAAADIADDDEIVVIGSQALLGQYPDAPAELCVSTEADVYPRNRPERADLIDGSIGEGSPFHSTYGYYAQGVGVETATLPADWQGGSQREHARCDRVVPRSARPGSIENTSRRGTSIACSRRQPSPRVSSPSTSSAGIPAFDPAEAFTPSCPAETTILFQDAGVCAQLPGLDASAE